jgi:formate dehydrogenase gamma subunit
MVRKAMGGVGNPGERGSMMSPRSFALLVSLAALLISPAIARSQGATPAAKKADDKKAAAKKADDKKADDKKADDKKADDKKADDKKADDKKADDKKADDKKAKKAEEKNEACLDCHSDKDNVDDKAHLVVDGKLFKKGPHTEDNGVTCFDCHPQARKVDDVSDHGKLGKATCAGCHDAAKEMVGSMHGRAVKGKKLPTCKTCHGSGHKVLYNENKASPMHRLAQPKTCTKCHKEESIVGNFMKSVHGARLLKGDKKDAKQGEPKQGPTCSSCHGGHNVLLADVLRNVAYKKKVTKACAKCHEGVAKVYAKSVHGQALLSRNNGYGAASCVDCHLAHTIQSAKDPKSNVHKNKVVEVCATCHADSRLIRRFKLKADVVKTYESSYHGRARFLGAKKVANCASCHNYHAIFKQSDPRSSVHKNNLKKSCGSAKCHPRATATFLQAKIHVGIGQSSTSNYWAFFVRNLYIWLIGLIIGGMIVHNLLDFIRKNVIRARAQGKEPHVIRMTKLERVLHIMLATSFLSLCYTGFALMYPKAWWVAPMNWISDTEAFRSLAHRVAGVVLTVVALHHLWFLFFHKVGKVQRKEFAPRLRDLRDLYHNIFWLLGKRKERPNFPRFSYIEKAEYWALVWGTAVMVLTGFVMWFEETSLTYMPLWLWEVFQVVHRFEAILAFLAIVVWHFYYVFANPDESPMSLTWLTGRMTLHELALAHPEEYEKVMAERRAAEGGDASTHREDGVSPGEAEKGEAHAAGDAPADEGDGSTEREIDGSDDDEGDDDKS